MDKRTYMIAADITVAFLVIRLWRSSSPKEGRGIQRALYLTMMLFIVAIFLVVML